MLEDSWVNLVNSMHEEDERDNWFYDSIKRYERLHMYDFIHVITHMELVDRTSMCVFGRTRLNEIMEISVPRTFTVAPHRQGLVKSGDLTVLVGGFTAAPVFEMKVIPKTRKLVISEEQQCGASVYDLDGSELINRVSRVSCELISPHIALNDEGKVLLSSTREHLFVVGDIEADKIITKSALYYNSSVDGGLQPCFVSSNVAALFEKSTGNIILQDIRNNKCSIENTQMSTKLSVKEALWTFTSSWNSENNFENPKLCLASNTGSLFVYDVRNARHALFEGNVQVPTSNSNTDQKMVSLHFHPKDDTKLSLSGFNENVYILKILDTNSYKTEFVHDGHGNQLKHGENGTVTTHMWYDEDTVISASEDQALHCWSFVADQA